MPPNVKESQVLHHDGQAPRPKVEEEERMPRVEAYRPMWDEPTRRMSIYQWLKGKVRDDAIGYSFSYIFTRTHSVAVINDDDIAKTMTVRMSMRMVTTMMKKMTTTIMMRIIIRITRMRITLTMMRMTIAIVRMIMTMIITMMRMTIAIVLMIMTMIIMMMRMLTTTKTMMTRTKTVNFSCRSVRPNLWRVNDNLYDLGPFLSKHPGGRQWLELTRGTDITEAFYVAHLAPASAEAVLRKHLVRPCPEIPRRSWFTFREDGFYMKFKARAAKVQRYNSSQTPTIVQIKVTVAVGRNPSLQLFFFLSDLEGDRHRPHLADGPAAGPPPAVLSPSVCPGGPHRITGGGHCRRARPRHELGVLPQLYTPEGELQEVRKATQPILVLLEPHQRLRH